ncbi:hypothetical protein GCM10025867_29850 [Frondihabitans sucicola]|uniref:Uncharacterized protein n=1 Tax=Frondihabitans sucicola TaxID=1268041 RepID=A0ABN6Y074_9MICO|nr:hypothetical protein [Frondihabitans sucicola]BDZ50744.1 hypothetical protein GCM10025867_29850 [Frondihabitans sucicola]
MESRRVTAVEVNTHGYVTRLCNEAADWSPQRAADVIPDLECGTFAYHVDRAGEHLPVVIAHDAGGAFLTTRGGSTVMNGLLTLPRAVRS